jgi:hypothetical protein
VHDDHVLRGTASLATDVRADLGDLWGADFFGSYESPRGQTGFWRPLVTLSFRLEALLAGGSAQGYLWLGHVTTVLCHLAATLALWRLLLALGCGWRASVVAAALFGLHPIHVANVTWTSGRVDSLATALAWAGTTVWLRGRGSGLRALGGCALFVLATLAKENAALLLGLAPLAGLLLGLGWMRALAVPLAALAASLLIRAASFGLVHDLPAEAFTGPLSGLSRWATWLSIQPDLLRFAIWPGPTSPVHPVAVANGFDSPGVAAGLVLLALLLGIGIWILRKRSPAAAYVTAVALGSSLLLAPWVRFPSGFHEVAGPLYERYLYAAVAAPALLVATLLVRLVGRPAWRVPAVMALAIACIGPITAARTHAWSSDASFARAGLGTAPGSANLWAHLGTALMEDYRGGGDVADATAALEAFDTALSLDPEHVRSAVNQFILLVLLERPNEASGKATALLSRWPGDSFVLHNVAAWHEAEGRLEQAAQLFERELATDRPHPETAYRLEALRQVLQQRANGARAPRSR